MIWIAPSEKDTDNAALESASGTPPTSSAPTPASRPRNTLVAVRKDSSASSSFASPTSAQNRNLSRPLGQAELRRRGPWVKGDVSTPRVSRRGSRVDEPAVYHAEGILYLALNARFDFPLNLPEAKDIDAKVNDAIGDIEKHNPQITAS